MSYDTHEHLHQVTTPQGDTSVDADAVYRSEQGWVHFIKYSKWVVLHVIAILVLMAIFLI